MPASEAFINVTKNPTKSARKPKRAKAFYGAIAAATAAGIVLNLVAIDPIKALFWSAVINGVVAVPVMAMMMLLGSRRADMGPFTLLDYKPLGIGHPIVRGAKAG